MPKKSRSEKQPACQIPFFGLYGTLSGTGAAAYAHIERISCRAPTYEWKIGSHRHADLSQFLLVTGGRGVLILDGERHEIIPPWFVWLPSGFVHGFDFDADTVGLVLTISADVIDCAANAGADCGHMGMLSEPIYGGMLPPNDIGVDVREVLETIEREQERPRLGVHTALTAGLMMIFVALHRVRSFDNLDTHVGRVQASEFRRFREYIEKFFRKQTSIAAIARHLGITPNRLHAATTRAVGKGPLAIQHERIMIECKRELIFTNKSISQIAFDCGFSEPAHFSRFFSQRSGFSPRTFRQQFGRSNIDT